MRAAACRSALGVLAALSGVACGASDTPGGPPVAAPIVTVDGAEPSAAASSDGSGPATPPSSVASSLPAYDPSLSVVRDLRMSRIRPRAMALLVVETRQLESLYQATDLRARDRPALVRRRGNPRRRSDRIRRRRIRCWTKSITTSDTNTSA